MKEAWRVSAYADRDVVTSVSNFVEEIDGELVRSAKRGKRRSEEGVAESCNSRSVLSHFNL